MWMETTMKPAGMVLGEENDGGGESNPDTL
jgi:hypothetical protein